MSKWFDLSNNANKIRQSYFKGFIDISGGGLYLRNDLSINFYSTGDQINPKFSIKSDSFRIQDEFGTYYNVSTEKLLLIKDLTQNAQTQLDDLINRTKYIKSDGIDIDTMLSLNKATNEITTYSHILPSQGNTYNLGSPSRPFGSIYVNQGTIHFINDQTPQQTAAISYNPTTGSLDLSTNTIKTSINNTRIIDGVLVSPLLTYDGKVGIGTTTPRSALDISGSITISGNAVLSGSIIHTGDFQTTGNLSINNLIYENGVALQNKYATLTSPSIQGTMSVPNANVSENLLVLGDTSLNGKLFVAKDVSLNGNVNVGGDLTNITQALGDSSTKVATTEFIKNQNYAPKDTATFTGVTTLQTGTVTQKFQVGGDVSLNSKLSVLSAATFNNRVAITGETTLNNKLILTSDASINGAVNIAGALTTATQSNNDNSTKVATTAFVKNQGYAPLTGANFTGDISLNTNLYVGGDVSLNNKLFVNGDTSMNGNLSVGGYLIAATQANGDNSTKVATTAFVKNQGYATVASPSFTGTVNIPTASINEVTVNGNASVIGNITVQTQSSSDNSTKVATTAFVKNQGYATVASPSFTGTANIPTANITQRLLVSGDASLNSNVFIAGDVSLNGNVNIAGSLTAPTQNTGDNSQKVATTAFVKNQGYAQLAGANFTGDIQTTGKILATSDASLNGNLYVVGQTTLLGDVIVPTQITSDNSTKVATTAFVKNQNYATLNSPQFSGIPLAPTASVGTTTTQIATTSFVRTEIVSFVNAIPSAFDAINQLKDALSQVDASFTTTLLSSVGLKADKDSPTFTGTVLLPVTVVGDTFTAYGETTIDNNLIVSGDLSLNGVLNTTNPPDSDDSTRVATTSFVKNQGYAELTGADFTGDVSVATKLSVVSDASFDSKLFVGGDASLNGQLYVKGDSTMNGNVIMNHHLLVVGDTSLNGKVEITGDLITNTQTSTDNSTKVATTEFVKNQGFAKLNGANFTGDVSFNETMLVLKDVSMNKELFVAGNIRTNKNVSIIGDLSVNNKLVVGNDVSFNNNLYVQNAIYENGSSLQSKYAPLVSPAFTGTVSGITKSMIDLANVDNTTDANKPISTATQTALDLKANIASPTFTGSLTAPIVNVSNNLFVSSDVSMNSNLFVAGDISLNGNVYATTLANNDNSTKVATTEFVKNQGYAKLTGADFTGDITTKNIAAVGDISLNGRIFASGDVSLNSNLYVSGRTTIDNVVVVNNSLFVNSDLSLNGKLFISKDISLNGNLNMNGTLTVPTPTTSDSSTKVATTAFVKNQGYAQLTGATFTGDISMNRRLYVENDVSMNSRLFIGGDVSLNSNLFIASDISMNGNMNIKGKTRIEGDVSFNSRVFVGGDISLNSKLFVAGDVSLNGSVSAITQSTSNNSTKVATTEFVKNQGYATLSNPTFAGTVTIPTAIISQNLNVQNDVYMDTKLYVTGDTSIGGDANITGSLAVMGAITSATQSNSDNSTKVATTAFVKNQGYISGASPTFTGTLTAQTVVITGDASLNGNLNVKSPDANDNSTKVATTAFVKSQPVAPLASPTFTGVLTANTIAIQANISVIGDSSMNGNLKVGQSIYENGELLQNKYATLASPTFTGTVNGITKSMVGLANVDDTSDANKPISSAAQSAIVLKSNIASPIFTGSATLANATVNGNLVVLKDISMNGNLSTAGYVDAKTPLSSDNSTKVATTEFVKSQGFALLTGANFTGDISTTNKVVVSGDVSLNSAVTIVGNAQLNSAVTIAGNTRVNSKLAVEGDVSLNNSVTIAGSVSLNGTTTTITQITSDNSTKLATTAYVKNQGFAALQSPVFTGVPTVPTLATNATTTDQIATTKYVENKISEFSNVASSQTLTAINQLASALSQVDSSFTTTLASQLSMKAAVESPSFTGIVTLPKTNLTQDVFVGGDLSMNGVLKVNSIIYEQGNTLASVYAKLISPTFTGVVSGIDKTMVGLTNVDDTSDANKPVSTATQSVLDLKANISAPSFTNRISVTGNAVISQNITVGGNGAIIGTFRVSQNIYENGQLLSNVYATLASPTFTGDVSGITKSMVGLANVDNTSDANKPVSTATQSALEVKANISSPTFYGNVSIGQKLTILSDLSVNGNIAIGGDIRGITQLASDNSTKLATTAFVKNQTQSLAQLTGANFTGDISLNTRLFVGGDASFNSKVFINSDLSVNGNISGRFSANSIPTSAIIGGLGTNVDLSTNQTIYGIKTFMNDVSLNGRLFIGGNINIANNNIVSTPIQPAQAPSSTSISNLTKLTNNSNGTYINDFEIAKANGYTIAYNTTQGIPVFSNNAGTKWNTMTTTGSNVGYNGMLCLSPDGKVRLKQERGTGTTAYLYISTNWGLSYSALSLAQPIIYTNATFGYNTYNNQSYAFSHDGSVLYFIARDTNNTIVIWKSTDASFSTFSTQSLSWNYALGSAPRSIATSSDGKYVLTITGINPANGMYLSISTNYGAAFTRTANSLNTTWNSIAVSQSGKYQAATTATKIFQSNDFGSTWAVSSSVPDAQWNFVSMSNDGKNRVACIDSSYQYISLDYGSTWNIIPNSLGNWKKAVITDMSGNDSIMIYSHDGVNVFKNYYNYVDTAQKTVINTDLNISSPSYFLNTMGKSLKTVKSNFFVSDIGRRMSMSDDGKYILLPIQNKQTLISRDYGETWYQLTGLSAQTSYNSSAMSENGQYMYIRSGSTAYRSSNYGVSWAAFTGVVLNDVLCGTALSSTGSYIVYAGRDSNNVSQVYLSTDSGATWNSVATFPTANTSFSVAMSSTGQYISALSTNSYVIVSSDYGATWSIKSALSSCAHLAVSSTGQYQTVISSSSIFVSSDYGNTFSNTYFGVAGTGFTTITMIGTGEYQYAVNGTDNKLYRSDDYGLSWSILSSNSTPSNTIVSKDGKVMVYSASSDIVLSRVADAVGTINETAFSISKKGIVSSLDLSLNGTLSTQYLSAGTLYENGQLLSATYATLSSPVFTGDVSGITKTMIGLANVDNTSDANKPVSTATQSALNVKANIAAPTFTGTTIMANTTISQTLTVGGDASFNSRLYIAGDVSLAGMLYANYAPNSIPPNSIVGGIPVATGIFNDDLSANARIFVNNDASFNNKLFVKNDTLLNSRVFVLGDASFNSNVYVGGTAVYASDVSLNSRLIVANDATFNRRLLVLGDASMIGNVYVSNDVYEKGVKLSSKYAAIETPVFSGTATFDKVDVTVELTVSNADSTFNGKLTTTGDVSFNSSLKVGQAIYEGGVSLISKYATLASPTFTGDVSGITKAMIGLGNADNTSDANKPISTAAQTALDLKSNLASPTLTGVPNAPTASLGTNTTQLATTAYVQSEFGNVLGSVPAGLNKLSKLAAAINNDASFSTTVSNNVALKANIASPTFTGSATVSDITVSGNLYLSKDLSFSRNLFVGGDVSLNGNLYARYPNESIPSSAIKNLRNEYGELTIQCQRADIVTFDDEGFETSLSSGSGGIVETLYARNSDLSLNGNIYINGTGLSIINTDSILNGNLIISKKAYMGQDVSMNNNLDLSGSLIAHNNVNVYGIINQYTLSLDQGYIVNYADNETTIESLQQQITTLQQQLANVLQILSNNNLQ